MCILVRGWSKLTRQCQRLRDISDAGVIWGIDNIFSIEARSVPLWLPSLNPSNFFLTSARKLNVKAYTFVIYQWSIYHGQSTMDNNCVVSVVLRIHTEALR